MMPLVKVKYPVCGAHSDTFQDERLRWRRFRVWRSEKKKKETQKYEHFFGGFRANLEEIVQMQQCC